MPNGRNTGIVKGTAYMGPGGGFEPFRWKPDRPTGKPLPSGPEKPIVRPDDGKPDIGSGRVRDPITQANLDAREEALKPRRWTPPSGR